METIDIPALHAACLNLAAQALWSEDGASESAVATLAGKYMRLATVQVAGVIESGRDPNIATRAINYLAYSHIAPPGEDATEWFNEMLTCLLELAVPSMIHTAATSAFFRDVQEGIAEWTGPPTNSSARS